MGDESLIAAVRNGDAKAVAALLEAGADPDAVDGDGTPVLHLAVDAFDLTVVELLMSSARLDSVSADGRTPLLRAIDRGAYDITAALIGGGAQLWHKDAEGRDALALARYWHETGAVAELRRRSGMSESVGSRTVQGEFGGSCAELSLGGLTVRTGHTAILTELEPKYGIRPSFDELMSRALAEPDHDHAVWWATTSVLQQRHDPAVRAAAAALRHRPDPLERYFGAQVLRLNLFDESKDAPFDGLLADLFLPWVAREPDPRVTWILVAGLSDAMDPRAEESLPAFTRHPDGRIRQLAVSGLRSAVGAGNPEALAAVLARTRDEDAAVRQAACAALALAPAHSAAPADALAGCLADGDERVRVTAAAQLALRDDPRGEEILRGLEPADEGSPYYWLLDEVCRHRQGGSDGRL
ncbi:ankyrin repeat domain-containing protein [Streptomyces piniterrae]|uniref:ankyrin repeat domain-containing protein n=1 Tax=Streptomyces piniterrae TaxID=2571125 RepID=UPI00145DBE64|nr:ankyrin repeat domain-containing protein [Streptomyces piniterrae]